MVYFKGKQEFFKVPGEWEGTNIFQGGRGVNFFQGSNLNTVFNLLLNFTSALTLSSFIPFSLFHFYIC